MHLTTRRRVKKLGSVQELRQPEKLPTASQNISATEYGPHTTKQLLINGKTAHIMIDSGAIGNFINPNYVRRHNLRIQQKSTSIPLDTIDGQPVRQGKLEEQTTTVQLNFEHHLEDMQFDLLQISSYDAILGSPWLKKHDPTIKWSVDKFAFNTCNCKWDPKGRCSLPPYSDPRLLRT